MLIALWLAKYFGTTPELWLNLQSDYKLRRARAKDWPKIEGADQDFGRGVNGTR